MVEPSLALIQSMVQRVIDGQTMLRHDVRNMRSRISRIEHGLLALQRSDIEAREDEVGAQEQIDSLVSRVERLERGP